MSGGCDGAIRFWDIRRAGCFQVLDQSRSQLGKRPPLVKSAVDNVCSLSLLLPFVFVFVIISQEYLVRESHSLHSNL